MGKKKNKIAKITEAQYYAYIAELKNNAALSGAEEHLKEPSAHEPDSEK